MDQAQNSRRGAGNKPRFAFFPRQHAGVDRMKPVDVFLRIEKRQDPVFVDLVRERELNEDPMNLRVGVQVIDQFFERPLFRVGGKRMGDRTDP